MEGFSCKTKVISGSGSIRYLGEMEIRRLLVVTDPYFYDNGKALELAKLSKAEQYTIFHEVVPDPTVTLAAKATAEAKKLQPDTIVALGGGSAIDCAKAVVYFCQQPVRLVAIPSTSGSGSEVTSFAVLTHEEGKHPLVEESLCPQVAILDSDLVSSLPKPLIADGGFDVLTHALEAYVARDGNLITDALAKEAFCVTLSTLPASYGGNVQVRQRIHLSSTMAGMAFTGAGLGLCHALSHALGGRFHLPHGRLNAILLPSVIGCNAHIAGSKYANLARAAGLSGASETVAVRSLMNTLVRLRRQLQMPQNLKEAGVDPRVLRQMTSQLVQQTLQDPCCKTNPLEVADFMVRRVLEEVSGSV